MKALPQGAVVEPQVVYDLGQVWYATRMARDWRRPDIESATRVFRSCGLDGEFWSLA